jgi:hypothetical protein
MNLIGEQVNHKGMGIGTITRVNMSESNKPIICVKINGLEKMFEYRDFVRGDVTAVRDDVQKFILAEAGAQAETQKNAHDDLLKEVSARKSTIRRREAAEILLRGQLQLGETLIHCDKDTSSTFKGVISLIPGAIFFISGIGYFTSTRADVGMLFYLGIGVLLLWYAFCQFTKANKNHYFVTDKRLGIREAYAFKRAKNIDIPINEIAGAYEKRVGRRSPRVRTRIIRTVKMKDGKTIQINNNICFLLMTDAIKKAIWLSEER